MALEHRDVVIVGAGLSGIGAAWHLQKNCPNRSYVILEGRERMGGTWDLFRYPGIRSDSDMFTLGYSFRPWTEAKSLADGPSILRYINDTASEAGIDKNIRYNHMVTNASWSSEEGRWTIEADLPKGKKARFTCNFLYICGGYYNYAHGYTPEFKGVGKFKGKLVHPQHWPEDLDYKGKRVVVIGSGATAITLVPSMADDVEHITMLQRSPTYILSLPGRDVMSTAMRKVLPQKLAYDLARWKNVLLHMSWFQLSRRQPKLVRKIIRAQQKMLLGKNFDIDTHLNPTYNPWDQRFCVVPDGDLFRAVRKGKASIVTDHIDTFTPKGIRLKSGAEIEADIIITATGLDMIPLGGATMTVDGEPVDMGKKLTYKGMMLNDVPNMVFTVGYTNASWTLKADLVANYACRLFNHLEKNDFVSFMPHNDDPDMKEEPLIDLASGYVHRALDRLPKQGSRTPWKLYQNYIFDLATLRLGSIEDDAMVFSKGKTQAVQQV